MSNLRVLSLGAGVQSTTLALMIEKGEIEPVDFAVFADTKHETQDTYEHLKFLINECKSFEIKIVSAGDLLKDTFEKIIHIPFHTKDIETNKGSLIRRQCTNNYKITPVYREIRKYLGLKKGERNKKSNVELIMGISYDELSRMTTNKVKWIKNKYPLVDIEMRRSGCIQWLEKNNYSVPPRSACYFCPYNSKSRWLDLKNNYPEYFNKSIEIDKQIRNFKGKTNSIKQNMQLFVHSSKKPLDKVKFEENNKQEEFSFLDECSGMCGN